MKTETRISEHLMVPVETRITCPSCRQDFSLAEGFAKQALDKLVHASEGSLEELERSARSAEQARAERANHEKQLQAEAQVNDLKAVIAARDKRYEAALKEMREVEQRTAAAQITSLKETLAARETHQQALLAKVEAAEQLKRDLAQKEQAFNERVALAAEARAAVLAEQQQDERIQGLAAELELARERAATADQIVSQFRAEELQLRRDKQALEDRQRNIELDVARQVDQQCRSREDKVRSETLEQAKMREADQKHVIDDLRRTIEQLQRKSEQGSQERQGEVFELLLEEDLKSKCPLDEFISVKKGQRGADVLHRVMTRTGHHAGSILWEAKRAANWSREWIPKLKTDQREAGAEIAVIVATTLPRELLNGAPFGLVEEVWVTSYGAAFALAEALRSGILEAHRQRAIGSGKGEKAEAMYDYLTSSHFAQKVRGVYESLKAMREELCAERGVMQQRWTRREKHLDRAFASMLGLAGDIQAISQQSLPQLEMEKDGDEVITAAPDETA